MSTIEVLKDLQKLDKNDDFVLTVNNLPSYDGSYRITVVAIYSHRYTCPITNKVKITVKQKKGDISMTSFISSPLNLTQCRKCKGWIYECHVNGWRTRVEPNPLNLHQELAMRIEGRAIFQTLGTAEPILVKRTAGHIAQVRQTKVLPEHSCQTPAIFEPAPLFEKPTQPRSEGIPF
jgi:hypothetical protein